MNIPLKLMQIAERKVTILQDWIIWTPENGNVMKCALSLSIFSPSWTTHYASMGKEKKKIEDTILLVCFHMSTKSCSIIETKHPNELKTHKLTSEMPINEMNCNIYTPKSVWCSMIRFMLTALWESAGVVSFMRFVFYRHHSFCSVFHSLKHFWMWIHSCLIAHARTWPT